MISPKNRTGTGHTEPPPEGLLNDSTERSTDGTIGKGTWDRNRIAGDLSN